MLAAFISPSLLLRTPKCQLQTYNSKRNHVPGADLQVNSWGLPMHKILLKSQSIRLSTATGLQLKLGQSVSEMFIFEDVRRAHCPSKVNPISSKKLVSSKISKLHNTKTIFCHRHKSSRSLSLQCRTASGRNGQPFMKHWSPRSSASIWVRCNHGHPSGCITRINKFYFGSIWLAARF